ncbi:MAG: ferritin-like domain-containing protein [Bacteroidetes bacterium]|nr:ferritin-like domain-containing protein [Bacteroidota bacterium]
MNLCRILDTLAEVESHTPATDRRGLISYCAPKLALTALPLFSFVKPGRAQTTEDAGELLRVVLTHTRLESSFLELALKQANLFPVSQPQDRTCIQVISGNKKAQLSFVEQMMQSAGVDASTVPHQFDFTGGKGKAPGPFVQVMEDYLSFLSLAQMLSDFGVRALKGAIISIKGKDELVQGLLQLQATEARHAARLRQLRSEHGLAHIKPWITQAAGGIQNEIALNAYAGEDNILQGGFDLVQLTGLSSDLISEAFDEPLGTAGVWAILGNFVQV